MTRLGPRPAWHADAACRGQAAVMFCEEKGGNYAEARRLCAHCPVRVECIEWAAANLPSMEWGSHGMWGGFAPRERRRQLRTMRRQLYVNPQPRGTAAA